LLIFLIQKGFCRKKEWNPYEHLFGLSLDAC
jgi:hypothetical protein